MISPIMKAGYREVEQWLVGLGSEKDSNGRQCRDSSGRRSLDPRKAEIRNDVGIAAASEE